MTNETNTIQHLPLDSIHPDPDQPRTEFDRKELKALANDISARGVIQPITVRTDDQGRAIIVYGERRWRASQLAGMGTIPTIVDNNERDPLDRFIDQASENLQRADFTAMELARFFDTLHTRHGIAIGEIPEVLKKRGLKSMSRSYISNMRRLVKLPPWAQQHINDGTLSPSHGKYMLQAAGWDSVMQSLSALIDEHIEQEGPPTIDDLLMLIDEAFCEHYNDLVQLQREGSIHFDLKTCSNCIKHRSLKGPYNATDREYCMDSDCMDKKEAEHQQQIEQERQQRIQQQDEEWRIGSDSNKDPDTQPTSASRVTPMRKPDAAASTSTGTAPEPMSAQQIALKEGRIERTEQHLDEWLRHEIETYLNDDPDTRYSVLLWIAAGAPGNGHAYDGYNHGLHNPDIDYDIRRQGINITLTNILSNDDLLDSIISRALDSMARKWLRTLAHHCGIQLEGVYQVNREYLEIKSKDELIKTTPENVQEMIADDWPKYASKQPVGELIDRLMEYTDVWGIPADLSNQYLAYLPETETATSATA